MRKGLVSIVVPVYKTEKYLDNCIESLVNQTYRNLEIILVDDGSPDRCPEMCNRWAAQDNRVKVIHKQNEGLGMARNTGIENAMGEYICFFDSDDFIDENTIEKAYCAAVEEQVDIVIFGFHRTNESGDIVASFVPKMEKNDYYGKDIRDEIIPEMIAPNPEKRSKRNIYMSAWMMIIRLDVINTNNWRFVSEKSIISEDVYSLLDLFQYISSIHILPYALYYYRTNQSSVSRAYCPDRYARIRHFYFESSKLCQKLKYGEEVLRRLSIPYLAFTVAALKQEINSRNKPHTKKEEINKVLQCEVLQRVLCNINEDKISIKKKILYWAMRHKLVDLCYLLLVLQNAVS